MLQIQHAADTTCCRYNVLQIQRAADTFVIEEYESQLFQSEMLGKLLTTSRE